MTNPRGTFREERLDELAGTRGKEESRAVRKGEVEGEAFGAAKSLLALNLFSRSASLGADVALTVANQWYDGPFIALTSGLWIVMAQAQHRNDAAVGAGGQFVARIWDGAAVLSASEVTHDTASGSARTLFMTAIVSIKANKVLTLQARSNVGSANLKLKATAPAAGADLVATRITAMRFGG